MTEAEVAKARARLGWQLEAMRDSPGDLASFFGFAELFGVARTPERRLQEFARVSPADVRAAARRLLSANRLAVLTVGTLSAARSRRLTQAVSTLD